MTIQTKAPIPSLLEAKVSPMTVEQSRMLITVLAFETDRPEKVFGYEDAKTAGPITQILWWRIDPCKIKLHLGLAMWLATLSKGNPGNAVMWAWALREMQIRKNYGSPITTKDWVDFFPMGVPTQEGLSTTWDAQKRSGGNVLDNADSWIMPV